jgi:hypothetical protein
MRTLKLPALVMSLALTACGGGGGGGDSTVNADTQGYWSGPASTGYTVNAVVLETGETWGVYSSGSTIYGALYGTTTTNGNNASITGTDFNFVSNTSANGTLSGPIAAKSSMSLTSANGVSVPLTYASTYDTAATTTAATGTWSFIGRSGSYSLAPGSITINGSGAFTLTQTNCTTVGSIVPRSGGKNVYNINLTASGSSCVAGQNSMTGVAYIDTTVTPNKFISLALTPNKDDGVIVIGTKQ